MAEECFNCGISGERLRLFDAISGKGIVKICKECASKENIPMIKKPSEVFIPQNLSNNLRGKSKTVYERLSRMSGYDLKNRKTEEEKGLLKKQETTLKDIVDKNFYSELPKKTKSEFLVDNFHWIIMRARRLKHITQEQLAKAIAEPEAAIKIIEKGTFPENSSKLINKLENYLKIKLIKKEFAEKNEEKPKEISFDANTTKNLTISDLQEMKKRKEEEIFGEKINEEESLFQNEEDLFQDEDDLIFEEES